MRLKLLSRKVTLVELCFQPTKTSEFAKTVSPITVFCSQTFHTVSDTFSSILWD